MVARLIEWVGANLGILVPLAGFLGVVVGVGIVLRVTRGESDTRAPWRYRDPVKDVSARPPRPNKVDVEAARKTARSMLLLVIGLGILGFVMLLAAPGFIGGMMYEPPWYAAALPWAGPAIYLIGLGWMIRIYRADPEPDETTWRYRS